MPTTLTNQQFADATGLHHTMASRLRNGERSPSISTVISVQRAYRLTCDELVDWLAHIERGPEASGRWLQEFVFDRDRTAETLSVSGDQIPAGCGASDPCG